MVRFVLWLVAALSLADFVPAASETSRFARLSSVKADYAYPGGATHAPVVVEAQFTSAEQEPLPALAASSDEPALDGDDSAAAVALAPRGKTADPAGITAAQCPDGQPLTAFNSRAPPAIA